MEDTKVKTGCFNGMSPTRWLKKSNSAKVNGELKENGSAVGVQNPTDPQPTVNGNGNGIHHHSHSNEDKILKFAKAYRLTNETLKKISDLFLQEMEKGLGQETHDGATVKMFPTFVREIPNGQETGKYLALDLGGTNFRVLLVELLPNGKVKIENKIYVIQQKLLSGPGEELFDHIASCLSSFVEEFDVKREGILPLGFTFSFPCKQVGLTKGILVKWTKGFHCSGVEGKDVVQLLREAVERRGDVEIDVVGIVNDTTGTLMSCAHRNRNCSIGLILGTGTNACYMEELSRVGTWDHSVNGEPKQVIINTEWGAFGADGCLDFIRTPQDKELDSLSLNPSFQIYEKMISGMYVGELVRLLLRDLAKEGLIFAGLDTRVLEEEGTFYAKYLSEIEKGVVDDLGGTRMALNELGLEKATEEDCHSVRLVCSLISKRAAYLAAAGTATLINRIGKPHVTVGVDGSLYRFHPRVHDLMVRKLKELVNPGIKFDLMLSEDGSGRGAALVAAVAARNKNKSTF